MCVWPCVCAHALEVRDPMVFLFPTLFPGTRPLREPRTHCFSRTGWPVSSPDQSLSTSSAELASEKMRGKSKVHVNAGKDRLAPHLLVHVPTTAPGHSSVSRNVTRLVIL